MRSPVRALATLGFTVALMAMRAQAASAIPSTGHPTDDAGMAPAADAGGLTARAGSAELTQVPGQPPDPLLAVLMRVDSYLHRHEVQGITQDPRFAINPAEAVRLSVVSQLLAYNDLHAASARAGYVDDIAERADFLLDYFPQITSGTAFDGMLGYALLGAYEVTRDERVLLAANRIVNRCLSLPGSANRLNWGLMSAMALAKYHQLTGSPAALSKTREILRSVAADQHADGSFAHYCDRTTDVHYTAWMGMELLHVRRYVDDPAIEHVLQGIAAFLGRRVDASGRTSYREPCPGVPGCWVNYYSVGTGCSQDYDTRAWSNELGYDAMVFDDARAGRYNDVMAFLYSLEDHGVFADKWDFPPAISDPIYPWGSAGESVIRTSVIFWSLASIYASRHAPRPTRYETGEPPVAADLLASLADDTVGPALPTGPEAALRYRWPTVDSLVIVESFRSSRGDSATGGGPGRTPVETSAGASLAPGGARATSADRLAPPRGAVASFAPVVPNPGSRSVTLRFTLARDARTSLAVFDTGGRLVRRLIAGPLSAGQHSVAWDRTDDAGRPCPSGLYFVLMRAAGETCTRRVLVTR